MKKKLKELRQLVADAKKAWQDAKKAKKAADEITKLRGAYETKLALLDEAEEAGKKDEDEITIPDDTKSADDNALEMSVLEGMITKSVSEAIEAKLPDFAKGQLTAESVQNIVTKCLKDHKIDPAKVTAEQIKTICVEAATEGIKSISMPSRFQAGAGDVSRRGQTQENDEGMIEIPFGLSKGNLPLHRKQLLNVLMKKDIDDGISEAMLKKGKALDDNFFDALEAYGAKAITTTGTGTGAEWAPRLLSTNIQVRMYLKSQVAQMMLANEIQMPSDPYDWPIGTTRPKFWRNNVQNREARASTPGTGKFTFATQKLMALVQYSEESREDLLLPILPFLERQLADAAVFTLEDMILNGDSAATHMDSDITDIDEPVKGWDGWRKLALAQTALKVDMSTGGVTRGNLLAIKRAMGKWGRVPGDLMWVTGGLMENNFLNLDEVITADKRGSAGTVTTGTINSYWGIPIVVSEAMREDLNAAGVYDGVTMTKGTILLVNRSMFFLGNRREFTIKTGENIKSDTHDIVASFRKAFKPAFTPTAADRSIAIGYNVNS